MKIVVQKKSLKQALQWSRRILFTGAVLMLGYCGFIVLDARIFEQRQTRNLERLLHDKPVVSDPAQQDASVVSADKSSAIATDGLIGKIEILRLGLSAVFIEGTGKTTLRHAAGHIRGTALPGEPGNVGIAGHRDTFFRPLRDIRINDIITLTTLRGEYHYRVVYVSVVSPHEVSVLNVSEREILTLVTCHPFYYLGAAPNRFIVRAERVTG